MKNFNQIIIGSALVAAILLSASCKNTSDPGPAGANGTNGTNGTDGNRFPYKQTGTTLNLDGIFYSDDISFDKLIALPFFSTLDENRVELYAPVGRMSGTSRTSATNDNHRFYITRYDSLGNSSLSFNIDYYFNGNIYVNDFHFNVKTSVTETSYKNVYTTYGGGGFRVSGPDEQESGLSESDMTNNGNSFTITNWSYDEATKVLSFDYAGTLTGSYNSTGNNLTLSGKVKANLKESSHRIAQ